MIPEERFDEPQLEKALAEIRETTIDPAVAGQAAQRVWARIAATGQQPAVLETIRGCAGYQALIPAYRAGSLSPARKLLLEDHTHECVACRKALEKAAQPAQVIEFGRPAAAHPWAMRPAFPWAMAAALVISLGVTGLMVYRLMGPGSVGSRAVIEAAEGMLYRVSSLETKVLAAGEELPAGEEIRSAKESGGMVRLKDGSRVEMRERSGFSVREFGDDLTIRLQFGAILVKAAKRRTGHLYVDTRDVKVAVKGTTFSVDAGLKGSRVSVVEGEVHVIHADQEKVLHAGDQFNSNSNMTPVPVAEDIAWSRNREEHLALLKELSSLQNKLEEVRLPDLRFSSRILDLLPAQTALYVSLPNLAGPLGQAEQVIRQKVQESPELRKWWDEKAQGGAKFEEIITRLRTFNEYLGEEIVVTASLDAAGKLQAPVFLAQLKRPGFREYAQAEWSKLNPEGKGGTLHVAGSAAELAGAPRHALLILARPELLAISPDAVSLTQAAAALEGPGTGRFPGTPFHSRISEAYRGGAGFLLAADLERITASVLAEAAKRGQTPPGIDALKYLVLEQRQTAGKDDTRAVLSFGGTRTGVAAWLARPAAIGSLEFISPEAGFAAGFVVKNPAAVVDELFAWQDAVNPNFRQQLAQVEATLGVSIRDDLAAPLGGEFAVAWDGPALPVPSWKVAAEVYDPARLQQSFVRLVEAYNRMAAANNKPALELTSEAVNGRTYYKLAIPQAGMFGEAHYLFVDGYLLAAPNRTLLDRAIQYRATGYTLVRSRQFQDLLPADRYTNFSAMVYQNMGGQMAPILEGLKGRIPDAAAPGLELKPTLVTVYGEEDRITVAGQGSVFGLSFANMIHLGLAEMLGHGKRGTPAPKKAYR